MDRGRSAVPSATRVWLGVAAVLACVALISSGLVALSGLGSARAAATTIAVSTNPTTVTNDVNHCPLVDGSPLCVTPHGSQILNSTVPLTADDQVGLNDLESVAEEEFMALHSNTAPGDPRITFDGEDEIRGLMFSHLIAIISEDPDQRSPAETDAYNWFAKVVQSYNLTAAEDAKAEFANWQSQGCDYQPGAPTPEYDPGAGCGPDAATGGAYVEGPVEPSISQLESWGAYEASEKFSNPPSPTYGIDLDNTLKTLGGVAAVGAASAAGAATTSLSGVASAVSSAVGGSSWVVRSAIPERVGAAFIDGGLASAAVVGSAVAVLVLAVVALILGIVVSVINAEVPSELDAAISAASATPDLNAMLNDTLGNGQPELLTLFLSQTQIPNPPTQQAAPPDWHGDEFLVQNADASGNPVSPGTLSKAVTLEGSYDAVSLAHTGLGSITTLSDLGWFEESFDGGQSYLTTTSLDYTAWDGSPRTAILDDTDFIDLPGFEIGGSTAICTDPTDPTQCSRTPTIKALDANGNRVFVTLEPERAVPATISAGSTSYTEGVSTNFSDPNSDPMGSPTTYTWQFESRSPAVGFSLGCTPVTQPNGTLGCDPAFNGNPVVTETGQNVAYTWPSTGTFHVRLTTTNAEGETAVSDEDVSVGAGAAPTITFADTELGPVAPGGSVKLAACFSTAAGAFALPTVTIDWGDGTVDSAQPSTGAVLSQGSFGTSTTSPPQSLEVQQGGTGQGFQTCNAPWSFIASHDYNPGDTNGHTYPISVTVADGEGQSTTNTSLSAQVGAATLSELVFAPTNYTTSADGFTPGIPAGTPEYNEGDDVQFELLFNGSPTTFGTGITVDFGDGTGESLSATCNPDGCTWPGSLPPYDGTEFTFDHHYASKPGANGKSLYTVTAYVSQSDGTVTNQYSTPVEIDDVTPTISNVTLSPSSPVAGEPVTVSGTVTSVDHTTPLTVLVNWADSSQSVSGAQTDLITLPALAHGSNEPFSFTQPGYLFIGPTHLTLSAVDDAGGIASQTVPFFLNDSTPQPSVDPVSGVEGSPVSLFVRTGAPPDVRSYTETVDWGDGTSQSVFTYGATPDGNLPSPPHTYSDAGTYTVTVTLDDGYAPTGTTTTSATIGDAPPTLSLQPGAGTVGSPVTLQGTINSPSGAASYTGTVNWQDGSTPQQFSEPAGTTTFSLSHTYALGGTYQPTATVTDQHGGLSNLATGAETIIGPPVFTGVLTPDGVVVVAAGGLVNVPYSFTFIASGYPPPTFSVASGPLPPGLNLDPSGILSGTPTATGSYPVTLTATNTEGSVTSQPVNIVIGSLPAFTADAPPGGYTGALYDYQFAATGFPSPTFAAVDPTTLPPGLSLSKSGTLSGTPTAPGSYTFAVTATNFTGDSTTTPITVVVGTGVAPTIASSSATTFYLGLPATFSVTTGGTPSPTLSKTGALPAGMTSIDDGDGTATLTGTPTAGGTFPLTISAHNGVPPDARQAFTLTVATPKSIVVTPANPSAPAGTNTLFTAMSTYTDGTVHDLTAVVAWTSSKNSVATISNIAGSQGVAHGIAPGPTTIKATLDGVSGSTTLKVEPAALVSITVTPANPSIAPRTKEQFTATGHYTDGSTANLTKQVTWSSSPSGVATIDSSGTAKAQAAGTTAISASFKSFIGMTSLTVT